MLEPRSLHWLLHLQAWLLPYRSSSMSADHLLPQGLVPESRQASSLLHALDSGDSDLPSSLPSLPHRAANLHSQSAVHDLHDDSGNAHLQSAVHDLHDANRDAHSQGAVYGLQHSPRMPDSQSAIRHLLVDGEVLHEEGALHDLHDGHRDAHSQGSLHGLQASALHPHGDTHSLRRSPSAGQAKLLRAASRLPPGTLHGLQSGLPAAKLPDLRRRSTWPKLWDKVKPEEGHSCPSYENTKAGDKFRRPSFVFSSPLTFASAARKPLSRLRRLRSWLVSF